MRPKYKEMDKEIETQIKEVRKDPLPKEREMGWYWLVGKDLVLRTTKKLGKKLKSFEENEHKLTFKGTKKYSRYAEEDEIVGKILIDNESAYKLQNKFSSPLQKEETELSRPVAIRYKKL